MTFLYPQFFILFFAIFYLALKTKRQKILLIVASLMIISLSEPVLQKENTKEKKLINEALIALDLSYSMRATDIKPSRLEAAIKSIKALIKESSLNRYALYGFTSNVLILSPLSSDGEILLNSLDALEVENILSHATSFKKLLQTLSKYKTPAHTLILFSDGGEERDLSGLVQIAKDAKLKIIAVGMATKKGSLLYDKYGKALKDDKNELVVTRLNPILQKLAEKSGGEYIDFTSADECAKDILEAFENVSEKRSVEKETNSVIELFWIPLLIALILFFFKFVKIPKKLLLLFPFLTLHSNASIVDWFYIQKANDTFAKNSYINSFDYLQKLSHKSMQSEFNKALLLYKMKDYKKCITILKELKSSDLLLKHKILFLTANAYAKQKEYDKARELYKKSLALKKSPDVLYNLKLILGLKDRKKPTPPLLEKKKGEKKSSFEKTEKNRSKTSKNTDDTQQKSATPRLGYKAYELINKGYFDEKNPW